MPGPLRPNGSILLLDWGGLRRRTEQIETVTQTGGEDPRIDVGIPGDVDAAKSGMSRHVMSVLSQVFFTAALRDQPLPIEMSTPACNVTPNASSISTLEAPSTLSPKKLMYCTPAPT